MQWQIKKVLMKIIYIQEEVRHMPALFSYLNLINDKNLKSLIKHKQFHTQEVIKKAFLIQKVIFLQMK